jgi:hypothetical protein
MTNMLKPFPRWRRALRTCMVAALAFVASMAVPALGVETFDVFTFEPPPGKRATTGESIGFSDATRTTFAVIGLYKSLAGTGDAARDFDDEWAEFVGKNHQVVGERKSETVDWFDGWKMTMGAAPAHSAAQRSYTVLLAVFTSRGTKASVFVMYNDDRHRPAIDKFLASLRLRPPPGGGRPDGDDSAHHRHEHDHGGAGQPIALAGTAPGFTFALPPGFAQDGAWYVARHVENRGGGDEITSALVRVPAAVRAAGNMGDALHALWRQHLPAEVADRAGTMVYRRYLGDGLPAQFLSGRGRENGRAADTLFTLYLVDCGEAWQPVIVAQTYEEPDNVVAAGVAFSAGTSYGTSAQMAEPFLAALRCPAARGRPLVDAAALPGDYAFGTGSSLQWVNIYTGATSMTAVSYGGRLHLHADGTYDYRFQGAHGVVGAMNMSTDEAHGRWTVRGDLLVLTRDDGKESRYRVAGLTQFPGGEKAAVFLSRLDQPVNPTTVTSGGDYFATKTP